MKWILKIVYWAIALFLAAGGLVYLPSISGFLLLLSVAILLPIDKWQDVLTRFLPKRWIKIVLIVALAFAAIIVAPSPSVSDDARLQDNPPTAPASASVETGTPSSEEEQAQPTVPPDDASATPTSTTSTAAELPKESSFAVHFIDVGQADSALVLCDGKAMLIDGGNVEDSSLIYSYLKKLGITHLDYVVCTHAHEDHVGGLAGALNYASADVAYCSVTAYDSDAFNNFVKALDKQGKSITVPQPGDSFSLGGATITIIGPINPSDEPNNTSIVMRIEYGDMSFLFTGDAQREEEQDILNAGYTLSSTVLKVGHHGSYESTTYPFLREVMPEYAVISVGEGNSYGHPNEDTLSRLRDADVTVYRTDMQGDIICSSDGKTVTFTTEKNADADTLSAVENNSTTVPAATDNSTSSQTGTSTPEAPAGTDYIINISTGKFHYPSCSSVGQMSEANKEYYTGSRDDLISQGYEPCQRCNP